MLYKNIEINCTEEELKEFRQAIKVNYSFHTFSEKYNNVTIGNPTRVENAKYYILEVENTRFLQTHSPFESGFVAITEGNAEEIINKHKEQIIDNIIFSKFKVTQEDKEELQAKKIEDLKQQLDGIQQAMAELSAIATTVAMPQQ